MFDLYVDTSFKICSVTITNILVGFFIMFSNAWFAPMSSMFNQNGLSSITLMIRLYSVFYTE